MSKDIQTEPCNDLMPKAGAHHAKLTPFEGKFTAQIKMWMGPGEPMVHTGTMTNQWQLDGLFLQQDYVGDASQGPFPSFTGKGYWGYNTVTQKYEGFWIDNASTMIQTEAGHVDAAGKVWIMHSEMPNPQTGQLMKKRSVITLIDHNHHQLEMFFTNPDSSEMKAMEINYVRV